MHPQNRRSPRTVLAALAPVLAIAGVLGAAAATAQAQGYPSPAGEETDIAKRLELEARPLFDGWYDPGRWVPLVVGLKNNGEDLQLDVAASTNASRSVFTTPVELPRGAQKRIPLLVQPGDETRVLVRAGGSMAEQTTFLKLTDGEPLVVVIGEESAQPPEVGALGHSARPIVVRAGPTFLPENALGWGSVDFVVLAGADLGKANEAQRAALAQWVALGGELVVTGGPGMAAALGALPEALRPAEAAGVRDAEDFGTLAALAGGEAPEGSAPIAVLEPAPGAVPIAPLADGAPLLVQRRYGDGAVIALAFDPALPPFANWSGADEFWAALHVQRGETLWSAPPAEFGGIGAGLLELPEFELPSLRWLLVLIAIYILLVGPVNYLVLRRQRRLDLAWVTIPALTLLFSALTYGAGNVIHGRELVLYELSAVRVIPEAGIAHVRSYIGLFSPGAQSYDVLVPGALVRGSPDGGLVVAVQGPDSGVRDFPVEQWALGGFTAEAVVDWPAVDPGRMTVNWRAAEGELTNPFGRGVEDAAIFTRGGAAPLGAWAASDIRKAEIPLNDDRKVGLVVDPTDEDDETRELRTGILSNALGASNDMQDVYFTQGGGLAGVAAVAARDADLMNRAIVYGWTDEPPLSVDVADRFPTRRVHTLLHAELPVIRPGETQAVPVVSGVATQRSDISKRLCSAGGALFENESTGSGSPMEGAEFRFEFGLGTEPGEPLWVELNGPPAADLSGQSVIDQVEVSLRVCDSEEWLEIGNRSFTGMSQVPLPSGIQAAAGERKAICLRLEPANFYASTGQSYGAASTACWEPRLVTAPRDPGSDATAVPYP